MRLFKNIFVYAPEPKGRRDVLVAGGQILAIAEPESLVIPFAKSVSGIEYIMVPGLVDGHMHTSGGGGEMGPNSRTPEVYSDALFAAGITSVVGCLGFDGIIRNLESLLMKTKALKEDGLSAWMYTGSYQVPGPCICDSPERDIALIEEIIGIGEVAIADLRSSAPNIPDLIGLVKKARLGGMLGGKKGIVHVHIGDEPDGLSNLHRAVKSGHVRYNHFFPTHCNRNKILFEETLSYAKHGPIDLTASAFHHYPDIEVKPSKAIKQLLDNQVPLENICMSSDACGSLPLIDDQGNCTGMDIGKPESLWQEVKDSILFEKVPFEHALATVTKNPADVLGLKEVGQLKEAGRADFVILDKNLNIAQVWSNGLVRKEIVSL